MLSAAPAQVLQAGLLSPLLQDYFWRATSQTIMHACMLYTDLAGNMQRLLEQALYVQQSRLRPTSSLRERLSASCTSAKVSRASA